MMRIISQHINCCLRQALSLHHVKCSEPRGMSEYFQSCSLSLRVWTAQPALSGQLFSCKPCLTESLFWLTAPLTQLLIAFKCTAKKVLWYRGEEDITSFISLCCNVDQEHKGGLMVLLETTPYPIWVCYLLKNIAFTFCSSSQIVLIHISYFKSYLLDNCNY